jgi:hypothetical protein
MRWLLRRRHAARQALQVTLHSGRRPLKLLEVFFGQTIKSECAALSRSSLVIGRSFRLLRDGRVLV